MTNVELAGWPMRDFSAQETRAYLLQEQPALLEISKDQAHAASIKQLRSTITAFDELRVAYAGTTDFVDCAQMSFTEYQQYLAIQAAQAKFLGAEVFRALIRGAPTSDEPVTQRLQAFADHLAPIQLAVEIHGGWESSQEHLQELVTNTDCQFVIDLQNLHETDLCPTHARELIGPERIAYMHTRNHADYTEHPATVDQEQAWREHAPEADVLWEPKTTTKDDIYEALGWQ